ncbi:MAG: thermonuclease family protein [Hyphomicrobiaceae bacterium]
MGEFEYWYKAYVSDVCDGDTITVEIDLGFHIKMNPTKIRLYGINTPEVRGEERPLGLEARDAVRAKILGRHVVLNTYRDTVGKYGRWLAIVYFEEDGKMVNLNDWLVGERLADRVDY